jgi:hypothetical protein
MEPDETIAPNPFFDVLLAYGQSREGSFAHAVLEGRAEVLTVEVKSEPEASEYGSVFIEFADHGVRTGLSITKADFYAIEIAPDRWVFLPTEQLKEMCRGLFLAGKRTKGGWQGRSEGVVLPLKRLLQP